MTLDKKTEGVLRSLRVLLCAVFAALLVAACGGGSSGGDDLIERERLSPNSLTLSIAPSTVSDQSPSTLTATLVDPDGAPVAGQLIRLDAGSKATLSTDRITTDANGEATALVLAASAGSGTLRASFSDSDGAGGASLSFTTTVTSGGNDDDEDDPNDSGISLSLGLTDAAGETVGTTETPITANRSGRARATVLANGSPVSNRVVTFTASLGVLSPASGTALTDAQGVAEITLEAGEEEGAGILTAEVETDEGVTSRQMGFRTLGGGQDDSGGEQGADVRIGSGTGGAFQDGVLALGSAQLGVGSSMSITAALVEAPDNDPWSGFATVNFSSGCASSGKASFDPASTTAIGGSAVVSYQPENGCESDIITASVTIDGEIKTAMSDSLTIIQSPPNSIEFLGAEPKVIGLRGSAQVGAPESSTLRFRVKNSNGEPVSAGEVVDFAVVADSGGFGVTSDDSASTNSEGIASVTVRSGTVPFVGSVRAQLRDNADINATGSVSVQSGVVTQDRFSIAVETLNPPAGSHLGAQVEVTVRAADRFGNWAPDGTRINFTTELGDIEGSCEIQDGTCSVTWTSSAEQQINYDPDRALRSCFAEGATARSRQGLTGGVACTEHDRFGRTTVTAWAVGEESFDDLNGNNVFDQGEQWVALPEAFRDDNETGLYEGAGAYAEEFMDYNSNGEHDTSQAFFRGLGCAPDADTAGHCGQLANVRASSRIALSTDEMRMYAYPGTADLNLLSWSSGDGSAPEAWGDAVLTGIPPLLTTPDLTGTVQVVVTDRNGNAPIVGTTIEFDPGDTLKAFGSDSCTVPNTLEPMVCSFSYGPADAEDPPAVYEPIIITATSGGDGIEQTLMIQVQP